MPRRSPLLTPLWLLCVQGTLHNSICNGAGGAPGLGELQVWKQHIRIGSLETIQQLLRAPEYSPACLEVDDLEAAQEQPALLEVLLRDGRAWLGYFSDLCASAQRIRDEQGKRPSWTIMGIPVELLAACSAPSDFQSPYSHELTPLQVDILMERARHRPDILHGLRAQCVEAALTALGLDDPERLSVPMIRMIEAVEGASLQHTYRPLLVVAAIRTFGAIGCLSKAHYALPEELLQQVALSILVPWRPS